MGELLRPFGRQTRKIPAEVFKLSDVTLIVWAIFQSLNEVQNRSAAHILRRVCKLIRAGRLFSSGWLILLRYIIELLRCIIEWLRCIIVANGSRLGLLRYFSITAGRNLSRNKSCLRCFSVATGWNINWHIWLHLFGCFCVPSCWWHVSIWNVCLFWNTILRIKSTHWRSVVIICLNIVWRLWAEVRKPWLLFNNLPRSYIKSIRRTRLLNWCLLRRATLAWVAWSISFFSFHTRNLIS